ncbi:MAG: alpha/beta hydrolase [Pseudorhodoplanes sp.]
MTFREYGRPHGHPILALHGTPGSGLKFEAAHHTAQQLGLRLICPDRWGYGGSDRPIATSLAAFAADLRAVADHLSIDRFGLLGVSGGGPFAAAAAAQLRDRVTRLALVCPVGPISGDAQDVGLFHRFSFLVLPRVPGAVWLVFSAFRLIVIASPRGALRIATLRACRADRLLMRRRDLSGGLGACFRDGLRAGVTGPVIDMALFSRRWPELAVSCPTKLWLGQRDRNVPLAAARRLGAVLRADCEVLDEEGHYWVAADSERVLEWFCS